MNYDPDIERLFQELKSAKAASEKAEAAPLFTTPTPTQITILAEPDGDIVARLTNPEGEFFQIPGGEIHFTYRHGERRRWYVNKSIIAFRDAVVVFNRFSEAHAGDEDTDSLLSPELRREFEQIEPLGDPETSLWSATIHDTEWGLLSLY